MSLKPNESLPLWTWRVLGITAVTLLLSAVVGIALISAGWFDPRPLGPLQTTRMPGLLRISAGESRLQWVEQAPSQADFSARLLAAHGRGERDIGYGLAVGNAQSALVVAVSPLGYVRVWQQGPEDSDVRIEHMPWQTWPHVRRDDAENEIQIDVTPDVVSVRLNRELLWQGKSDVNTENLGLYLESFGGATAVDFRQLTLYYEEPR